MSEPTFKLPERAEALLADFPITEPDFEAQAKAIEARLAAASADSITAALFAAPDLAPESGEPTAPSSARAASAPKSNFAEMARRSVAKKDDDAAQMAKELLAATAQSRRPDAQLVERVRAAGRATATPLPIDSAEEPARPSGVVSRTAAAAVAVAPTAAKKEPIHPGTIFGIAGTLIAIAACVALFLKSDPTPSAPTAAIEAARQAGPAAPHAVAPSPVAAKPSDVMTPEGLAKAPEAKAIEPSKGEPAKLAGGASAPAAAKPSAAPSAAAEPQQIVLDDEPAPSKPPAAEAKPEPEPPMKPAEGNSGSVPLTPSAGAVSTALGAVRSGAQACLAGQTDPVSATITFAPDGHVLRVNAGGPASACIQAALSKARIAPFARESFSASTTIRPP